MKKLKFGEDLTNAINELINIKKNEKSIIQVAYNGRLESADHIAWHQYQITLDLEKYKKGNAFELRSSKIICKKNITVKCSFNISYMPSANMLQTGSYIYLKRDNVEHKFEFYSHGLQGFISNLFGEMIIDLKAGDELYLKYYVGDSKKTTIYGDGSKTHLTLVEI